MKTKSPLFLLPTAAAFVFCVHVAGAQIVGQRCEYLFEPLGIDVPSPRFTWEYSPETPFSQESARIIVSDDPESIGRETGNVWDFEFTGPGTRVACAPETGLKPYTRYYWKIYARGTDGCLMESPTASFETGKTAPAGWDALWISDGKDMHEKPSPLFRKRFTTNGDVSRARLYISGLGYYEVWINGRRVGDRLLDPAYTHFDKRVYYFGLRRYRSDRQRRQCNKRRTGQRLV